MKITVNIQLEIECLDDERAEEALEVLDTMLDNGVPQDSFNECEQALVCCPECGGAEDSCADCDKCEASGEIPAFHITSAVVRRVA